MSEDVQREYPEASNTPLSLHMKGPTRPNHFISPNSLSYCGMPLRRWLLRCHTTNWESQQGPLFGPLHRLCTATVITTIIWLPETSNGIVEAAGICIAPFDLENLNKASSHSVKGVKVTTSWPPLSACHSCLPMNHLYCRYYFGYKSNEPIYISNPGLTKGLVYLSHKRRQKSFWRHTSISL